MQVLKDIRFGLRTLAKSPGFTCIAILSLTLGIGANATVFTLVNGFLVRGLPFDRSDRILYIINRNTLRTNDGMGVSYPDFRDWRAQAKSFEGLAAWTGERVNLSDDASLPETFLAERISANFFELIGQKAAIGRSFTADDEKPGAAPIAILTYSLWERRYGRSTEVIGRSVHMNGTPTTIVGVMPRGFQFNAPVEMWLPLVPTPALEKREARSIGVMGRMAEGVTVQAARTEIEGIARNLRTEYPAINQNIAPWVRTYNEFFIGPIIATTFLSMLGAVSFVLLIACANVANLMLARAVRRSREISVRIALGAGRWRIIRQLLIESTMLSIVGGFFGWLLAMGAVRWFDMTVTPMGKPPWITFPLDYTVLAYLAAISIGTGILFGLAPALRLSKLDVNAAIKDGGRGSSVGARGRRVASILIISELALAVVLLDGAGLMVQTFLNIAHADLGIQPKHLLTMRIELPPAKYPRANDQISFHESLKARLESIPGVDSIAIAEFLPTGGSDSYTYELEGSPTDNQRRPTLSAIVTSPGYFRTLNLSVLRGRFLDDTDGLPGRLNVLVNERFATNIWPDQDQIDKRLRLFDAGAAGPGPWLTVVGVVPNIIQNNTSPTEIDPLIYLPYRFKPAADMAIIARTRVPPGSLGTVFRRELQKMDPDLPIYNLWTMEERLLRNYWFQRLIGVLFAIFAGIALLLAALGLNALITHSVTQRTQEIGIRTAMGASPRDIRRMVLSQGMRQLIIGLFVGLAGAFAATRALKSVLVQISPGDPRVLFLASIVLFMAALLGCIMPTRRATQVDPLVALRHE